MPTRNQFSTDEQFSEALRDWFAGQALAGLLSGDNENDPWVAIATYAYELADGMMEQRAK